MRVRGRGDLVRRGQNHGSGRVITVVPENRMMSGTSCTVRDGCGVARGFSVVGMPRDVRDGRWDRTL